ncbi:unnamed protein product [Bubo scandiacus]
MPPLGNRRHQRHQHCQVPLCRTLTTKTNHLPTLWREPGTPSRAQGAAMSIPQWLVLLTSLVPPALGSWGVAYPKSLWGVRGSCVMIPCTLSYPDDVEAGDGVVAIWYKDYQDQKLLVYHSEAQEVDAHFRDRAKLLGDPATGNCTLLLRGVTPEDSGPYRFRFEIVNGDRWSATEDVVLSVSDDLERPSTAASEEQTEGQMATLECSTPYVCPPGDVALRWEGYDPQVSMVAGRVQLDTSEVSHRLTLTTSFSWKDHSKKLLCEVSYGSRKATGEVVLRVRHAPKDTQVSVNPSAQNIRVGDTVSFTCEVSSSYPPISAYHWYKDGVAVGTEQILTLRDVRREDYGQYHCEVKNAVGAGVAPAVTLYIFSAEISVSPAAEVREGTAATLSCDVPGREGQDLNYTWYKNGAWLKEGMAHTLLFHRVAASDAGYYSCKVTNDRGSDMSQAITLSVTSPSPLPQTPPRPPTITLFQETQGGGLAIIRCAVDSHPPATVAIYREGTLLAASGSQAAPRQRFGVTVARNALRLEIHSVGPGDSGEYRCTAGNAYGNASAAKLFVARAAELLIQPSAEVWEGAAVTLTCLGARGGVEETLYTWYRNGKRLRESSAPTLRFPSVRGEDAGAFQCEIRSSNGSDTSAAAALRVLFPPRQPVLSSFLQSQGGRLGVIQCTVESDPEANLTLWRGPEVIACTWGCPPPSSPRLRATSSYNSLKVEIQDVVLEDEGTYWCQAGNAQGNTSAAVDFRAETASIAVASVVPRAGRPHCQPDLSAEQRLPGSAQLHLVPKRAAARPGLGRFFGLQASGQHGTRVSTAAEPAPTAAAGAPPTSFWTCCTPHGTPHLTAFLETERGRLAIFQCSVASNPPAQLALHRGEELVATGEVGSSPRVSVSATPNALRVEIPGSARVLISPSAEVREGDDASLTCQVAGERPDDTIYTWYKDSERLRESPDNVLQLPRVTSTATGSYHCRARGPTATSVSPAIALRISSRRQSWLSSRTGCWWLRRRRRPVSPPRRGVTVTLAFNALRVSIGPVLLEDEGEYVCSASNALGNASAAANFTAGAARLWISPSPDVREGDAVNLTCAVRSGGGEALSYAWYKNGLWVGGGPTPALAIPRVAAADAASYRCAVRTPTRTRSSAPATLNVLYPPRNLEMKAFLESGEGDRSHPPLRPPRAEQPHLPPSQRAEAGAPRGLRGRRGRVRVPGSQPPGQRPHLPAPPCAGCTPGAVPSSPWWSPGGGQQAVLLCTVAPNSLRVGMAGLEPQDTGLYVCSANNSFGTASSSLRLDAGGVTVTVEPSADVPEGATAHRDLLGHPVGGRRRQLHLVIRTAGGYGRDRPIPSSCPASPAPTPAPTAAGASGTRGHPSPAPVSPTQTPPGDISISTFLENRSGRVGIVLCTADSHPASTIALYRRGQLLASSLAPATAPGVRASPSHNTLRLELGAVGPEDAGEYICVAGNPLGNATAGAYFDVHTLTHLLAFTVLAGLLLAVICVATLALLALKMWPRIRKFGGWSGAEDTFELRNKQEQVQVDGSS